MAANGSQNTARWIGVLWPILLAVVSGLMGGIVSLYAMRDQLRTEIVAQIIASRAEERAYQDERRSHYPTTETMLKWQNDQDRALSEIRTNLALLREEMKK